MRALVVGGAGLIGSSLVKRLLKDGHEVVVWDNFSSSLFPAQEWGRQHGLVEIEVGDILSGSGLQGNVDVVFHLAARTSVPDSWKDIEAYERVNALGTFKVLEAAKRLNAKRFVYASTAAVYGSAKEILQEYWGEKAVSQMSFSYPRNERDHPFPLSPYAVTKLQGEQFVKLYGQLGIPFTIVRFFNVFGGNQRLRTHSPYASAIPAFIRKALAGEPPTIYGDGQQTRDFVYVEDIAEACVRLSQDERAVGETYNLGSGKSCSVLVLWEMIRKFSRKKLNPVYGEPRLGEIRDNLADIRKVQGILGKGWPRHSLKDALWETFLAFQTGKD